MSGAGMSDIFTPTELEAIQDAVRAHSESQLAKGIAWVPDDAAIMLNPAATWGGYLDILGLPELADRVRAGLAGAHPVITALTSRDPSKLTLIVVR